MPTEAYRQWDARGRDFELARPVRELEAWAERHKIAVLGTIGNAEHLHDDRPQDHTPFASTAWPYPLLGYVVCAIDLKNAKRDGVTLGEAIERQARAGKLPWLKYMNHGGRHLDSRDLDGDGKRWEVYPSDDEHVHLSIRTDWIGRSIGDFDPWNIEPGEQDFDMATVGEVWHTDGLVRAPAAAQDKDNEHWRPGVLLTWIADNARSAMERADAAADGVAALTRRVNGIDDKLDRILAALPPQPDEPATGRDSADS